MHRSHLLPVLLAAVLLVGAANLGAYAATGGPLLLGQSNTASKTTTLKTTGGSAALSLKSKKNKAPLKVSNSTRVAKLNADLVDGQDSKALQTKSYVYDVSVTSAPETYVVFALPGLPPGKYLANYSVTAKTAGAATLFGCLLLTGPAFAAQVAVAALGVNNGSDDWFVSGSGLIDTTSATYRFVCQRNGGTAMTIPASVTPLKFPAQLTLTRVDDATTASVAGVGGALPRHALGR